MGLVYERRGSGPTLVLLHGVGHRRQAWDAVLDRLTPHRDVILIDLPGHGESPPLRPDGRPVLTVMLDAVTGLLDDLGVTRPHFAGNSLGGRLCLEAGVTGRAATVTALSPAGFWRGPAERLYSRAVFKIMEAAGAWTRPLAPALARSVVGRAVVFRPIVNRPARLSPQQALGDMTSFVAATEAINLVLADMTKFSGNIPEGIPVTIGWGSRDRLLFPRQARRAKARLPQVRLVRLPGCGHVPMTDDPALVADVLLRGSARG